MKVSHGLTGSLNLHSSSVTNTYFESKILTLSDMHPSAIENVNTMFPHFQRGARGAHTAAVKDRKGLGTG